MYDRHCYHLAYLLKKLILYKDNTQVSIIDNIKQRSRPSLLRQVYFDPSFSPGLQYRPVVYHFQVCDAINTLVYIHKLLC